jgi:hypothetical protein
LAVTQILAARQAAGSSGIIPSMADVRSANIAVRGGQARRISPLPAGHTVRGILTPLSDPQLGEYTD